jgi:PDZ domain-containing protein
VTLLRGAPSGTSVADASTEGRVRDASRFVHAGAARPTDGRLLITTVTQSTSSDMKHSDGIRAMRTSQENAIAAAKRCLGIRTSTSALKTSTQGVAGPSGGLILALAAMDALNGKDLTLGRNIAGTGTIRADGAVGNVLHIGLKAQGAEHAGADLFLVPQAQVGQARRGAGSMRVAGVGTLDEAVRVLTGSGCPA